MVTETLDNSSDFLINWRDENKRTSIYSAIESQNCDIIKELLKRGAEVNVIDKVYLNLYFEYLLIFRMEYHHLDLLF